MEEDNKITEIVKENVAQTQQKQVKNKKVKLSKECKVVIVNDEIIGIHFVEKDKIYGIALKNTNKEIKVGDLVEVEYQGEIGKKNFKVKLK